MIDMETMTRARRYVSVIGVVANTADICVKIYFQQYAALVYPIGMLVMLLIVNVYGEHNYREWKREKEKV